MREYFIVSFLDSFDFPLREATRKEVWWEADYRREEGYDVTVLIAGTPRNELVKEKDGIKISVIEPKKIPDLRADVVHCLTGSVSIWLPLFRKVKAEKKILTLTDGWMLANNRIWLRKLVLRRAFKYFDTVAVYSEYQKRIINDDRVIIVKPHLPKLNIPDVAEEEKPTVLYMGHISKSKGFDAIIPAMRQLLTENPDLRFVVANNMIQGDGEYLDMIKALVEDYPDQVIIKGIVNPLEELKKAWVYIYPFNTPMGTMAFALSLYEAEQCGTPFVACDVSANAEFFDRKYLIQPDNCQQLYDRIKLFLDERKTTSNIR
jgi:glycosyltransferase involved in cell wall biosynthesis